MKTIKEKSQINLTSTVLLRLPNDKSKVEVMAGIRHRPTIIATLIGGIKAVWGKDIPIEFREYLARIMNDLYYEAKTDLEKALKSAIVRRENKKKKNQI